MAKMATNVQDRLAQGQIDPVYCLHGGERFLVDRCVATIRRLVTGVAESSAASDYDVFDLRETPILQVIGAAKTLPMWSKRRLVIGHAIDEVKADELEPLAKYILDPNPKGCLVLVGDKIDGRLRAFAALRKAGYLHELVRLKDRELAGFVAAEAKQRGLSITSDAAQALAGAAGPDLGRISQALDQVALFANGRIERQHVEEVIPDSRERGVFELTRAIGDGNVAQSLRLLANLLDNREPPLKLQFMLMRQLRQIWRTKELLAAHTPRAEIAAAVGVAPFFLDDILGPATRMTVGTLRQSFMRLYEADRSLKSSRVDPGLQMMRLVRILAEGASRK